MGQQQLLLILLGIIIVGAAIAVGILVYSSQSVESNRDSLVGDINNVSAAAWGYYMRAQILGGGGGSFLGFVPPQVLVVNDDGNITYIVAADGKSVTFTAVSKYGYGTIQTSVDVQGKLAPFVFTGDFQ
ncbi:MAG: hypothetical protein ABSF91_06365 [Bacteroidota bacterium]|jgi:hypothetical protein